MATINNDSIYDALFMKYRAYWLHLSGDIIPVQTTHIAEVIKAPEQFGYTLERIKSEYTNRREPIGFEGKARQVLMDNLIRNRDWIRARYTPRSDSWIVELNSISSNTIHLLVSFFTTPEVVGTFFQSTIRIVELSCGGLLHSMSVSEISEWQKQVTMECTYAFS